MARNFSEAAAEAYIKRQTDLIGQNADPSATFMPTLARLIAKYMERPRESMTWLYHYGVKVDEGPVVEMRGMSQSGHTGEPFDASCYSFSLAASCWTDDLWLRQSDQTAVRASWGSGYQVLEDGKWVMRGPSNWDSSG